MTDSSPKNRHEPKPPQVFAWLASGITISLIVLSQFLPRPSLPRGYAPWLRGTGVLLLLLAGVLIAAPFYLLKRHGSAQEGRSYMQSRVVVDRGLYAIVRHPQYLGYSLLSCGFALLSGHWASILLAVVGVVLYYLQAVREERQCLVQLGEPYEQYCRRVPRFNIVLGVIRYMRGRRQ